jgi:hypothetical protein
MMRPLLLVLLLASPALADPLPLLPLLSWSYTLGETAQFTTLSVATSQFTAFGNADGDARGTFQGVDYCTDTSHACGNIGDMLHVVFVGFIAPVMSPAPPCANTIIDGLTGPINTCPSGDYPVQMTAFVSFPGANFDVIGTGIGTYVETRGFLHASGPAPVQTAEPMTLVLFVTGIVLLMARSSVIGPGRS